MISGYIYVMSNVSLCGLVKVGVSFNSPHDVVINNSKNEFIPDDFVVEYYSKFINLPDAETIVRNELREFHYKKDFYNVDKESVIIIIENINLEKNETYVKKLNSNIIKLENDYYIKNKEKVVLKKFYNELRKIKKSIKNFPLRSENYLIYTTYHIEENYRSLLDVYEEICTSHCESIKQQKELSLVYREMLNCIKLKNSQKNKYVEI